MDDARRRARVRQVIYAFGPHAFPAHRPRRKDAACRAVSPSEAPFQMLSPCLTSSDAACQELVHSHFERTSEARAFRFARFDRPTCKPARHAPPDGFSERPVNELTTVNEPPADDDARDSQTHNDVADTDAEILPDAAPFRTDSISHFEFVSTIPTSPEITPAPESK